MSRSSPWPYIAATAGLLLLALLLFTAPTPKVKPRIPGGIGGEQIEGRVLRVVEEGNRGQGERSQPYQVLDVRAESGSVEGATLQVNEEAIGATGQIRRFKPGDRVILSYSRQPDGSDRAYILAYVRVPQLLWLAAIFAIAIGLTGGLQGLSSLLGLAVSFLIILRFIIPHILAGENPVVVSVVGAILVQVLTLYLSHGLNRKTTAGLLGTMIALVLTGLLGSAFIGWTRLSGLETEEATYLAIQSGGAIQLQGLLLSGLIIATLGVLDDVAVAQSSAVFELHALDPTLGMRGLVTRAMRIGRDHIAATVNTLFLAYAGASLPLLLLLSAGTEPLSTLVNREFMSIEIVNALVGSLGLIAAVPLTTLVAAWMVQRGPVIASASGHVHHH